MKVKPNSPASERNGPAILGVLCHEFAGVAKVLEIGSGTGQHAVRIAAFMTGLTWQTSDLRENHAGIRAWLDESGLRNVRLPLDIDVRAAKLPARSYDGVFSANTAHIMGFEAVRRMFALAGSVLTEAGVFCLYGPFRQHGEFNSPSNAAFDAELRASDPAMGIRDLHELDEIAADADMLRQRLYAMPANNHLAVWRKAGHGGDT